MFLSYEKNVPRHLAWTTATGFYFNALATSTAMFITCNYHDINTV